MCNLKAGEDLLGRKKATTLAEEFLRSLGAMLSERGFKRVPRRATFHRLSPEGWVGIGAPITLYADGAIVVALTAIIRFEAVEQLVLRFKTSPLYVDGPDRATFALYLTADTAEARGISCTIYDSEDLSTALAWANSKFESQARPFFEAFPTLSVAYDALTAPVSAPAAFDFPSDYERAKRVLAAAVALGHKADLARLIQAQRRLLAEDPQAVASDFDDFARQLMDSVGRS